MAETSSNLSELKSLAPIFELLGTVWLREVDETIIEVWNGASEFIAEVLHEPAVVLESGQLEHLATEYCRLFIGPKQHFPPIQSIWTSGQLDGNSTKSMRLYRERLGCGEGSGEGVTPDHLGVQMQLFAILLRGVSVDSLQANEIPAVDVITEFAAAHLTWDDDLLKGVIASSADFYNQVARLTQLLLSEVLIVNSP